jgi:hypothetical protein
MWVRSHHETHTEIWSHHWLHQSFYWLMLRQILWKTELQRANRRATAADKRWAKIFTAARFNRLCAWSSLCLKTWSVKSDFEMCSKGDCFASQPVFPMTLSQEIHLPWCHVTWQNGRVIYDVNYRTDQIRRKTPRTVTCSHLLAAGGGGTVHVLQARGSFKIHAADRVRETRRSDSQLQLHAFTRTFYPTHGPVTHARWPHSHWAYAGIPITSHIVRVTSSSTPRYAHAFNVLMMTTTTAARIRDDAMSSPPPPFAGCKCMHGFAPIGAFAVRAPCGRTPRTVSSRAVNAGARARAHVAHLLQRVVFDDDIARLGVR